MQRKNRSTWNSLIFLWKKASCSSSNLPTAEHTLPPDVTYGPGCTHRQLLMEQAMASGGTHYAGSLRKGLKVNLGQQSMSVWNGSAFPTTSAIPFHKLGSEAALELSEARAAAVVAAVAPRGRTSITRGLSMIRAVRFPFSTMPTIHAW